MPSPDRSPAAVRARLRSAAGSFWGRPLDHCRTIVPGVAGVSTPGHGGIVVDPDVFPLAPGLRDGLDGNRQIWTWTATGEEAYRVVGFEEDCSWAVLIVHHPELAAPAIRSGYFAHDCTPEYLIAHAHDCAVRWHPDKVPA